jgi:exosome complex RNA-binding protein Csl4
MIIVFKQQTTLTIVEEFNEAGDEIVAESRETFKAGERVNADIIDEDGPFVTLEFGNSGVAFAVERESFNVLSANDLQ